MDNNALIKEFISKREAIGQEIRNAIAEHKDGGDKYNDYVSLQHHAVEMKMSPMKSADNLKIEFTKVGLYAKVETLSSQVMRNTYEDSKRVFISMYSRKDYDDPNALPRLAAVLDDGYVLTNNEFEEIAKKNISLSIFHHIDMDGEVSAAMVSLPFTLNPSTDNDATIRFYKYNYKIEDLNRHIINIEKHTPKDKKKYAIVVDLSMTARDIKELLLHFDKVIWLDHHSTSTVTARKVAKLVPHGKKLSMIIDTRVSSAYSCYSLFRDDILNTITSSIPGTDDLSSLNSILPALVSIYDTKKDEKYPNLYKVACALNQYFYDMPYTDHSSKIWYYMLYKGQVEDFATLFGTNGTNHPITKVIFSGLDLVRIDEIKKDAMYKAEFKYSNILMNPENDTIVGKIMGLIGNGPSNRIRVNEPKLIKVMMRFDQADNIIVSAYSDNPVVKNDVNLGTVFSELYGGGGHPGAAGFNFPYDEFIKVTERFISNHEKEINELDFKPQFIDYEDTYFREDPRITNVFNKLSLVLLYRWYKAVQ